MLYKINTGDYLNWRENILHKRIVAAMGQDKVDSFLKFYVAPGRDTDVQQSRQQDALGSAIPSQVDTVDILDA
jgi:hypothetical protein